MKVPSLVFRMFRVYEITSKKSLSHSKFSFKPCFGQHSFQPRIHDLSLAQPYARRRILILDKRSRKIFSSRRNKTQHAINKYSSIFKQISNVESLDRTPNYNVPILSRISNVWNSQRRRSENRSTTNHHRYTCTTSSIRLAILVYRARPWLRTQYSTLSKSNA
jgi:hypothetical protein